MLVGVEGKGGEREVNGKEGKNGDASDRLKDQASIVETTASRITSQAWQKKSCMILTRQTLVR